MTGVPSTADLVEGWPAMRQRLRLLLILATSPWLYASGDTLVRAADSRGLDANVVHQIWVGARPAGAAKENYAASVIALTHALRNATGRPWRYRRWSNQDVSPRYFPRTYELLHGIVGLKLPWAMASDVMRYEIVARSGGVYIDMVRRRTSLPTLLNLAFKAHYDYRRRRRRPVR